MTDFELSESAIKHIAQLKKKNPDKNKFLRIAVDGGGCAGFRYSFELENSNPEDDKIFIFKNDGDSNETVSVLVDEISLDLIAGSTLNYITDLIGSSFRMDNPNTKLVCGCGVSFTPKAS